MASSYPINLDNFLNPTSGTTLPGSGNPALGHALQHENINDAMEAVQSRLGVTGSTVATTIDYELHNVDHGHDHDGVNSRPVALGPPLSGSTYDNGLFPFVSGTRVGGAIDAINQTLLIIDNELSGGISGALTPTTRDLIILADSDGPFEGYAPGSERVTTYHNNVFPSSSIWYTDASKTSKIMEVVKSYPPSGVNPTTITYRSFETDGFTVRNTVIDTIAYSGIQEVSRSRVII